MLDGGVASRGQVEVGDNYGGIHLRNFEWRR